MLCRRTPAPLLAVWGMTSMFLTRNLHHETTRDWASSPCPRHEELSFHTLRTSTHGEQSGADLHPTAQGGPTPQQGDISWRSSSCWELHDSRVFLKGCSSSSGPTRACSSDTVLLSSDGSLRERGTKSAACKRGKIAALAKFVLKNFQEESCAVYLPLAPPGLPYPPQQSSSWALAADQTLPPWQHPLIGDVMYLLNLS